jgi:iron(III) transport system substrate-binding protein
LPQKWIQLVNPHNTKSARSEDRETSKGRTFGMNRFRRSFGLKLLLPLLIAVVITACSGGEKLVASNNLAKEKEPAAEAIYLYKGSDREAKLIEKAKEEGDLNLYTGMNPEDMAPFMEAFEKKYGIKVSMWRASGGDVTLRMITEAQAKRYDNDMVVMTSSELEKVAREGVLNEFYSPYLEDMTELPSHKKWAPAILNFYVMAWNPQKVKPEDVPKTYEDLLDSKWKGNFSIEAADQLWFANVVKQMGEEKGLDYFKKLAQNGPLIRKGHTLISQLIVAGEVPLTLTVYNHQAEKLKKNGATIDWKPLQPMVGEPFGVGVNVNAKHPNAALLFADFMMSPDGQKVVEKIGRVPASKKATSELNDFKYKMADPAIVLDEWDKWDKLWEDLFLKGAKK